ncbi:ATP-binding protein [Bradyrhizobium sp. 145]|nr:ATP-binding protein [Bradyrhizobium sp. 145]
MATFRVRARTVDMLGRQQIAGIPTAISELFKNAHDAYARNVEVDYFRRENLFVLRDDGLGMTKDDFEQRWLTPGKATLDDRLEVIQIRGHSHSSVVCVGDGDRHADSDHSKLTSRYAHCRRGHPFRPTACGRAGESACIF